VASTILVVSSRPTMLCNGGTALLYAGTHHGMPRVIPR